MYAFIVLIFIILSSFRTFVVFLFTNFLVSIFAFWIWILHCDLSFQKLMINLIFLSQFTDPK